MSRFSTGKLLENVASSIRVHKLTVLPKSDVVRSLGFASDKDRESLVAVLCRAFCPPKSN